MVSSAFDSVFSRLDFRFFFLYSSVPYPASNLGYFAAFSLFVLPLAALLGGTCARRFLYSAKRQMQKLPCEAVGYVSGGGMLDGVFIHGCRHSFRFLKRTVSCAVISVSADDCYCDGSAIYADS